MAALVVFPFMAIRFGGIPNRCLSVTRHRRANLLVMWPQATGRATPNNPGTAPTLPPVDTHRLHRCESAEKADEILGGWGNNCQVFLVSARQSVCCVHSRGSSANKSLRLIS